MTQVIIVAIEGVVSPINHGVGLYFHIKLLGLFFRVKPNKQTRYLIARCPQRYETVHSLQHLEFFDWLE
jgi:hypothetical protein